MRWPCVLLLLAACGDDLHSYDDGYRSGTQAAIRWYETEDGARFFDHWIDRETGAPCTWVTMSDGFGRCVDPAADDVLYDGDCRVALWTTSGSVGFSDGRDGFEAFALGRAEVRDASQLYEKNPNGIGCIRHDVPPHPITVQHMVGFLPNDRFAIATVDTDFGDGLRPIARRGSDGSAERMSTPRDGETRALCTIELGADGRWDCRTGWSLEDRHLLHDRLEGDTRLRAFVLSDPAGDWVSPPLAIHDTALDVDCAFEDTPAGPRCVPAPAERTTVFTDERCETTAEVFIKIPRGAEVVSDLGAGTTVVHRVGDPVDAFQMVITDHPECVPIDPPVDAHLVGEPLGFDELANATQVVDP